MNPDYESRFGAGPSRIKQQPPPTEATAATRVTVAPTPATTARYQAVALPEDPRYPPLAGRIGRYDEEET